MAGKNYFYIDSNGTQQGPRSVEQLIASNILTPQTIVWCEGMTDWLEVAYVPELNAAFRNIPPQFHAYQVPPIAQQPPVMMTEPCPRTWLVESILATLFCCVVTGIVGVIYSSKVDGLWRSGRYDEARSASNTAKTYLIIGILLGLATVIGYVIMYAVFGITSLAALTL